MTTTTKSCKTCNTEFQAEDLVFNGRVIFSQDHCQTCIEKMVEAQAKSWEDTVKEKRESLFWRDVPPLYRATDPALIREDVRRAVEGYEYSPRGLGFIGKSGAGKTRAAVMILHRLSQEGKTTCFMKATSITQLAREKFDDDASTRNTASAMITNAYKADMTLIDDIGKGRLTPTAEELMFDIIDRRAEQLKPILWTSNMNAQGIQAAFSEDRGDALIRRLREFTRVISCK